MACQFTDEQTGGHCPTLADRFTGTNKKWFTFTNGVHTDSLDPETANRLFDFLKLYVAKETPALTAAVLHATAPVIYQAALGIDGVTLPPDPIQQELTYAGALAAFERQPPVRILFDNGAGRDPGHPYPGYEHYFDRLPVAGTKARAWRLGPGGALGAGPAAKGADVFRWDPGALPRTNFTGNTGSGQGGLWRALPAYNWRRDRDGNGLAYVTDPLEEAATVIGAGAVHVWVRSSAKPWTSRPRSARSAPTARSPSFRAAGSGARNASSMRRRAPSWSRC